tara:strand:- start:149 stop:556 length:408 start_codon:yes stop_codon:yes gene_type:complete
MTLSDAREALFQWFEQSGSFSLERDASKLLLITDGGDEEKKACILATLQDFIDAGMIKRGVYEDIEYYFLIRPFEAMEQQIQLNAQTARTVSKCINNFCDILQDQRDRCDPTNVTERDVFNLTNIIEILSVKDKD